MNINSELKIESEAEIARTPSEIRADFEKLVAVLESLYISKDRSLELHFSLELLPDVERAFDAIIHKHGIREVDFSYQIQADGNPRHLHVVAHDGLQPQQIIQLDL